MKIYIRDTARKRGYSDDQIAKACQSGEGMRCRLDDKDPSRELRIGFDSAGDDFELVGLMFDGGARCLIIHVMRARPVAYRQVKRARRYMND